jgi:hypothetical protein
MKKLTKNKKHPFTDVVSEYYTKLYLGSGGGADYYLLFDKTSPLYLQKVFKKGSITMAMNNEEVLNRIQSPYDKEAYEKYKKYLILK